MITRRNPDGFVVSVLCGSGVVIDGRSAGTFEGGFSTQWHRFNTTEPLVFVVGETVIRVEALPAVGDDRD